MRDHDGLLYLGVASMLMGQAGYMPKVYMAALGSCFAAFAMLTFAQNSLKAHRSAS